MGVEILFLLYFDFAQFDKGKKIVVDSGTNSFMECGTTASKKINL